MMKNDFTVLIVGRENVGKSSLFNRLINKQKAIVDDFPGVTRDKIYGEAEWLGRRFTIIDTGGLLFNEADRIKQEVVKIVRGLIKEVDFVIFVTDVDDGILPEDREILDFVKRSGKEFVTVVNKVDNEARKTAAYEFYNLGVDIIFPMSVTHSMGLDDLLDYIIEKLPVAGESAEEERVTKVAIVGRENAGKSSLFNALIKEERSIVTEIPGTTRDSIDSLVEIQGKQLMFIDTAGVKKRKKMKILAEEYSIGRAFANVKRADIALLVVDAAEGILEMDKKMLGYACENYKGVILVINKWDLIPREERDRKKASYSEYLRQVLSFADFAPILYVSALEKKGLEQLIEVVFYVENQYNFRVKTSLLNKMFQQAMYDKQPFSKKGELKIYYISQVEVAPPTFAVFVNKTEKIHFSYMRYIENRLRETFGFSGVPLKLKIKKKVKEKLA
jgi:GTP-binding protein